MNKKIYLKSDRLNQNIFGIVFLLASILFFAGLVVSIVNYKNDEKYYVSTRATISEIFSYEVEEEDIDGNVTYSTEHEVYVDYEVNGVLYKHVLYNSYNISMQIGDVIEIIYDSRDPTKISSTNSFLIPMILCGLGGLGFLGGSVSEFMFEIRRKRKIEKLISEGVVLRLPITYIYQISRHFTLECLFEGHTYESEHIKPNSELYTGCSVNVYFDSQEYQLSMNENIEHRYIRNYYIDIDSVEEGEEIEPKTI